MSKKPVKDVFGFWQLEGMEGVDFFGKYEIPIIHGTSKIPEKIIPFSLCKKETETENKSVHFYELDEKFVSCLESKAKLDRKIDTLKKYQSVILPDFSVYRDMPLAMQIFQIFKSRAIGNYLNRKGIKIIPNVRWGDERTYEFAFDGIDKWSVVAVGVQGAYRDKNSRFYFEKGFLKMLDVLAPETVICYGTLTEDIIYSTTQRGVKLHFFPTEISKRLKSFDVEQPEFSFDLKL
ncbi:DUF4417 domain-containing protein [Candidatus Saccharibacteria bacterium]|nr:DUF4417 domain-containing protein [Candidatus Saccharibacteria bacterium]